MLFSAFARFCRYVGGDGVDIRSGCTNGTNSAAGPIRLSKIGKKNVPFTMPISMTASNSQKKWRTIKSKCDVDSIRTASSDVSVACTTGANDDCNAKRMRRSRFPTDVTKPCREDNAKRNTAHGNGIIE